MKQENDYIESLNNTYTIVVNNEKISRETKIEILRDLLSKISDYHCYRNGKTACPCSSVKSDDSDDIYKETMVLCSYFNVVGYSYNDDNIDTIFDCPIEKIKTKVKSFLDEQ